jgi:hypothetical protein
MQLNNVLRLCAALLVAAVTADCQRRELPIPLETVQRAATVPTGFVDTLVA